MRDELRDEALQSSCAVDVIVPCYRYGRYLTKCVESVLTQSHKRVRVLILDDASPDDTAQVAAALAAADPRVTLIRHRSNKGPVGTFNEGLEWASGDYVLLLSADDYLLPGAIERAVKLLDGRLDLAFVFGRAIELMPDGTTTMTDLQPDDGSSTRIISGSDFLALCGSRNIVPSPTAFVRTALQKRVGGYRAELPHTHDMEMWLRLSAHGPIGFVNRPQAVYRRHGDNLSSRYYLQSRFPDLFERKAAFDCFMRDHAHLLTQPDRIRSRAMRAFSRDAVGYASDALNKGEVEFAEQIAWYATKLRPDVTRTIPWFKLALKRHVGAGNWLALRRHWTVFVVLVLRLFDRRPRHEI